jgi:hypothetical protein
LHGAGITPAPGKSEAPKGEKKRKPRFTVSKETTYVTGPLDKDGYIDYVTALNERLSKGVTPENNANVLFWQAFGPRPEGKPMPPAFFKWLGYRPPERGDYFIGLLPYLKKRFKHVDVDKRAEKINEQLEWAAQRPWAVTDYPHIASWLKANTHPLALVVEGTRRSHYYSPLVPDPAGQEWPGLLGAPVPGAQKCRECATVLAARAMLRLGEGRYDDAWQDLLACHRLARLVAHGGSLLEALIGNWIEAVAADAELAYLDRARLNSRQLKVRLDDLLRLPAMPGFADQMDLTERFTFLEAVLIADRGGHQKILRPAFGVIQPPKAPEPFTGPFWAGFSWDATLREGNRWFDRFTAVFRLKDRREREKHLLKLGYDRKMLRIEPLKLSHYMETKPSARDITQVKHKFLRACLLNQLLTEGAMVVPESGDRVEQRRTNVHVAFALAAYKQDHGRYPTKLDALAPTYLPQVPRDLFSGKPLIYHPAEKGYLLYSVGVNGEDEQGRSDEDDPPGDDLAVRMPLPPLRRE